METRNRKSEGGPNLVRAGVFFGVALLVSLGVGLALHSGGKEPTQTARADRPAAARARAVRPAAQETPAAAPAVPAVVTADEPAAGATTQVAAAGGPAGGPDTAIEATVDVAAGEPVRYEDAEAAYFAGDRARAAALFERYTARKPDNAWGHYMLGLSRWKTGDLTGAETAFQAALAIAPDHEKSLVNLSRALLDDGRAADALPYVTKAVEGEAPSADAHRVHGRVLHTLGRTEEALAAYAEALAIDPEDAWSLNNAGLVLIEAERFDEAADYLARACDADSSEAVFRNNLGIARERLGDYGAAETEFAKALDLDGACDKARVSLARVAELADAVVPAGPAPTPDDVELAASADPAGPETSPEE